MSPRSVQVSVFRFQEKVMTGRKYLEMDDLEVYRKVTANRDVLRSNVRSAV